MFFYNMTVFWSIFRDQINTTLFPEINCWNFIHLTQTFASLNFQLFFQTHHGIWKSFSKLNWSFPNNCPRINVIGIWKELPSVTYNIFQYWISFRFRFVGYFIFVISIVIGIVSENCIAFVFWCEKFILTIIILCDYCCVFYYDEILV